MGRPPRTAPPLPPAVGRRAGRGLSAMAPRSTARSPGVDRALRPPQPAELSNEMPLPLSNPPGTSSHTPPHGQPARTPPPTARGKRPVGPRGHGSLTCSAPDTRGLELLPSRPERGQMTLGTGIPAAANSFHGRQRRAEAPRAIHVHSLHRPGLLPGGVSRPPPAASCAVGSSGRCHVPEL